jgi:hypothetical protein
MPFEALDGAADELGLDQIINERDDAVAALTTIVNTALPVLAEHPAHHATLAADELSHGVRERLETGYLPEDNVERAAGHAERYVAAKRAHGLRGRV